MRSFQKAFCVLLFSLEGLGAIAVTISDVTARTQNGKVDIGYSITGADATNTALVVTMIDNDTGKVHTPTEEGRHRITWDTAMKGLNLVSSNVTATVSLVRYSVWQDSAIPTEAAKEGLYCVIDLSEGPDATQWPVSYCSAVPPDGWTAEYKTMKLVLRRIEAGTFIMGYDQSDESHRVTLPKPFYMGVFEVTEKQFALVMDSTMGGNYPIGSISYDVIRGSSSGAWWPASSAVDASSFLGRLRAKTGLDFDLPTEAQWEYACRAGTTTTYYWGNAMDDACAWYKDNSGSKWTYSEKIHPVGTKLPNAWGLYDMIGNVWEMCRDASSAGGVLAYGTDPRGWGLEFVGTYVDRRLSMMRVSRGGSGAVKSDCCTSSNREANFSSDSNSFRGFRLSLTLP